MVEKKTILIYWTSRTFIEIIIPIISDLTRNFKIVVVLTDYSTPAGAIDLLDSLQVEGTINKYYITPHHLNLVENHLFTRRIAGELRAYNFDFWLTASEIQVRERYLLDCVLPEHCISIIMWHNITFLFMYNKAIVGKLLAGERVPEFPPPRERVIHNSPSASDLIRSVRKKVNRGSAVLAILKKLPGRIAGRLRRLFASSRKRLWIYLDRVALPWLLAGRTFRLGSYDAITQIGSGRSNVIIVFDELEAKVHQLLFKDVKVMAAKYPTSGSCTCRSQTKIKTSILSPLSNFVGANRIPDDALALFYRDFRTVLDQTNAETIDLRLHPDETGEWPYELRDYLLNRGIESRVVDSIEPLRKIVCHYLGVAGSASASLRDCRAVCDFATIIGFVGVSRFQLSNPRFAFAGSEGIDWIEEDGSFDPNIFQHREYKPPERRDVGQILNEMAEQPRASV